MNKNLFLNCYANNPEIIVILNDLTQLGWLVLVSFTPYAFLQVRLDLLLQIFGAEADLRGLCAG